MSENATGFTQDRELVPRALIRACVFLVIAVTTLVAFAVITDRPKAGVPEASPIVAERLVSFEIKPRGAANVYGADGALIHAFGEGEAGFMDAVQRALMFERQKSGVNLDGPVTIARLENGRHVMIDPNSGWRMHLIGFGGANVTPFATLLADQ